MSLRRRALGIAASAAGVAVAGTAAGVVHRRRVEPGEAGADLVDQADDPVDGCGAVLGAVRLAASARGADRVVHIRFGAHEEAFR